MNERSLEAVGRLCIGGCFAGFVAGHHQVLEGLLTDSTQIEVASQHFALLVDLPAAGLFQPIANGPMVLSAGHRPNRARGGKASLPPLRSPPVRPRKQARAGRGNGGAASGAAR